MVEVTTTVDIDISEIDTSDLIEELDARNIPCGDDEHTTIAVPDGFELFIQEWKAGHVPITDMLRIEAYLDRLGYM